MVWHAEDLLLCAEVAVKVVKPNLALHRRFRSRFAREVAVSTRVVHPHVVPVHDAGVLSSGEPFVALGFASGGSLADLLKQKPPLQEVLDRIDEVLDALAAIHARSLLHQDLKPANVLLHRPPLLTGQAGQVKTCAWVADLGVADALAELNRDRKGISGTPAYMAPEQLMGHTQELGPWTDLYAVGLMLFEILSGERPHNGEGRQELLEARLRPPPRLQLGGTFGVGLSRLVMELMDPDPRQRFDRAADVRGALRNALRGEELGGRVLAWRQSGVSASGASTGPVLLSGATPLSVPLPSQPHEGTPRWNRVAPTPIPHEPPPEHGWQAPARSALALFSLREIPLVGREREQLALWQAAREVINLGQPRVVLVVGEAGSGKSRLLESLGCRLEEGGWMEVVRLRYHSPPGMEDGYRSAVRDTLIPWNDTREGMELRLRRWLSRDYQKSGDEVGSEAQLLTRWCGYLREGESPPGDAVGLAYLYRYLDARAWRGGSCMLLQDVHHAQGDGDGLAIAEALLDQSVGERPILLVASIDSATLARDAGLRRKVEALQERGALRLGLRRLNMAETRRVIDESLTLAPELARLLTIEYEGDPIGLELLLRDWALRRLLEPDQRGLYRLRPGVRLEDAIPLTTDPLNPASLAHRRIEAAIQNAPDPRAAREVLYAAALSGLEPPAPLIRALNDAGLDALLAVGILAEQNGYLSFEHAQIRDAAIVLAQRSEEVSAIHLRLAQIWAGLARDMDVDLAVGTHLLRGGQPEKALTPLLRAVRRMNQGGRARSAIRVAVMAIEAADRVGQPGARLQARRLHAEALVEVGEPERALPLLQHALSGVDGGDRLERARLRVLLGRACRKIGDLEGAARELDNAWQVFETMRDRNGLIEVATQRARLALIEGAAAQEIEHWGYVLRNRIDPVLEAEARNGMVHALVRAGRLQHIDAQLRRLEGISRLSADVRRIAEATWTTALVHILRRQLEEAERLLNAASAIAATLGADNLHLRCRTALGEVCRYRGDREQALKINRQLIRFCDSRGWSLECAGARVQVALLALARKDLQMFHGEVAAAETDLKDTPRHGLWLHVGLLRAVGCAVDGDERGCRAWWAVARERGIEERHAPDLWLPLERLGVLARERGWEDIAGRALQRLTIASSAEAVVVDIEDFEPE